MYLVGAYFGYCYHAIAGFPPVKPLDPASGTFLFLAIFFILIPSAQKITLGKILTFEGKVKEVKEEIKDFKSETRLAISTFANLAAVATATSNQSITVNLPSSSDAKEAEAELEEAIGNPAEKNSTEKQEYERATEPLTVALQLVSLRISIEKELRRIMGKRTALDDPHAIKQSLLSVRTLMNQFLEKYPKYSGMQSAFNYVIKVCNAVTHAQEVPADTAYEALDMGTKIVNELKSVP
ncbi:hypothetical protein D3C84_677470 [compost metagenome]